MRFLLLLPLCLTLLSAADDRPNFSGTWKMDADRSDFGQIPKPASLVRKVDHQEPKIHLVTTFSTPNGEVSTDLKYTTDGKEAVNNIRGSEWKSTVVWDGKSLEVASKRMINDAEVTTKERWTLMSAGKVLTVVNNTVTPNGPVTFTVVMNKQ
jgi:hypothetical protein